MWARPGHVFGICIIADRVALKYEEEETRHTTVPDVSKPQA
jgi:hypothetical protein